MSRKNRRRIAAIVALLFLCITPICCHSLRPAPQDIQPPALEARIIPVPEPAFYAYGGVICLIILITVHKFKANIHRHA